MDCSPGPQGQLTHKPAPGNQLCVGGQNQSKDHEMLYFGPTLSFSQAGNMLKPKNNGATLVGTISTFATAVDPQNTSTFFLPPEESLATPRYVPSTTERTHSSAHSGFISLKEQIIWIPNPRIYENQAADSILVALTWYRDTTSWIAPLTTNTVSELKSQDMSGWRKQVWHVDWMANRNCGCQDSSTTSAPQCLHSA